MSPRNDTYLTPGQVAELLLVSPVTVRQWARKGWLEARTTPGGHRRFLRSEVERFARERSLRLNHPGKAGQRLLIVEDDPQFSTFLMELLTGQPGISEVATAANGFEAGIMTYDFRPDVVLLDLMIPGLDGFSVCTLLKKNPGTRHIRILAMTGYFTEENRQRILKAGAEACLAKPFDPRHLLDLLEGASSCAGAESPGKGVTGGEGAA